MHKSLTGTLLLLSFSVFAQEAREIKVDAFSNEYGTHRIHSVDSIEVLEKVEGNRSCWDDEPDCDKKYLMDKIVLKVSGSAEGNFGSGNKIGLNERTLRFDYGSGSSVILLKFQRFNENPSGTLVYDNVGYAQWSSTIPFDFKIEIHSDLNERKTEKEFRIPVSAPFGKSHVYRFKVVHVEEKWTVEILEKLQYRVSLVGEAAKTLMDEVGVGQAVEMGVSGRLSCVVAKGIPPYCASVSYGSTVVLSSGISQTVSKALDAEYGLTKTSFEVGVSCENPNRWNELKEMTCHLELNDYM